MEDKIEYNTKEVTKRKYVICAGDLSQKQEI